MENTYAATNPTRHLACEQDGRARTKQHTQFPLTNIRFHSNSSKVGIFLTLSGASAERRLPRFVVHFPCVVLIGSLAPHSSRNEHARLVPVSNSLRHRQVIEIEAVQIATRELSDQSASSFGHASVSGHSGTLLAKACRFNLLSMTQF